MILSSTMLFDNLKREVRLQQSVKVRQCRWRSSYFQMWKDEDEDEDDIMSLRRC